MPSSQHRFLPRFSMISIRNQLAFLRFKRDASNIWINYYYSTCGAWEWGPYLCPSWRHRSAWKTSAGQLLLGPTPSAFCHDDRPDDDWDIMHGEGGVGSERNTTLMLLYHVVYCFFSGPFNRLGPAPVLLSFRPADKYHIDRSIDRSTPSSTIWWYGVYYYYVIYIL